MDANQYLLDNTKNGEWISPREKLTALVTEYQMTYELTFAQTIRDMCADIKSTKPTMTHVIQEIRNEKARA